MFRSFWIQRNVEMCVDSSVRFPYSLSFLTSSACVGVNNMRIAHEDELAPYCAGLQLLASLYRKLHAHTIEVPQHVLRFLQPGSLAAFSQRGVELYTARSAVHRVHGNGRKGCFLCIPLCVLSVCVHARLHHSSMIDCACRSSCLYSWFRRFRLAHGTYTTER